MCLEKTIFDDLYLKLNKRQEKHQNICKIAIITQQTFVGLEHVLKTSSRHVLKTPWRRLEDVSKTSIEDILNTLWRQAKYLLGISVSNKSKCVSKKSIFNKSTFYNSKANPKCIK